MSDRSYPRIVERGRVTRGLCGCCGSAAITWASIQVNWFRGDDCDMNLCAEHDEWRKAGRLHDLIAARKQCMAERRAIGKAAEDAARLKRQAAPVEEQKP